MKPAEWLPLVEVFVRVRKFVGDGNLALRDIKQALVDGRVASMERALARSGGTHTRELSPKFWQTAKLQGSSGQDHIAVRSAERPKDCDNFCYFLRRSDVEKLWPENKETATADENPWRKSGAGAKGDYNWERILIEAAGHMYENSVPQSLTELCKHVESWCGDDAPGETQLKEHLRPLFQKFKKIDGK
jgi:hypothetical protein